MQRLFTGSFAELKSARTKPYSYSYDPRAWNSTKDSFESCKHDFEKGKTSVKEVKYWKNEVEKENPNQVI